MYTPLPHKDLSPELPTGRYMLGSVSPGPWAQSPTLIQPPGTYDEHQLMGYLEEVP